MGKKSPRSLDMGRAQAQAQTSKPQKLTVGKTFTRKNLGLIFNNPILGHDKGSLASNMSIPTILK